MAGYPVDNQLKGAAKESTAAATVTAAETADSEDKDGDANVKGFFGWIHIIIS
jgi:hypothetical protein